MPLGETATAPSGSAGVVASACLEEEIVETREALAVVARDHQPESGDGLAWAVEGDLKVFGNHYKEMNISLETPVELPAVS